MSLNTRLSPTQLASLPADIRETILKGYAEADSAAKAGPRKLTPKVSAKGAVSIYGFGQWPVTLYIEQLERLEAAMPEIMAFAKANKHLLKTKGDATAPAVTA